MGLRETSSQYIPNEFGNKIQNIRKNKKLTQRQFADKCGISQQLLSHIEMGWRRPNPSFFLNLISRSEFFSVEELVDLKHKYFNQTYGMIPENLPEIQMDTATPKVYRADFKELLSFLNDDYKLRSAVLFLIKWKERGRLLKMMAANRRIRKIIKDITLDENEIKLIIGIQKLVHMNDKQIEHARVGK
jgi:transcriptional regulator with XRE-family HTH domain